MDEILLDFLERLGILLIGVLLAIASTTIITMAMENGAFAKLSKRRIVGLRFFGGLAGLLAGLGILSQSKNTTPAELVFALWFVQVGAGMGGGEGWKMYDRFLKTSSPEPSVPGAQLDGDRKEN